MVIWWHELSLTHHHVYVSLLSPSLKFLQFVELMYANKVSWSTHFRLYDLIDITTSY
jgi:hypothetical protein